MVVLVEETFFRRLFESPMTSDGDYHRLNFRALGTDCQVFFSSRSVARARDLRVNICRWMAWFEARYSRFQEDSLVSRINRSAGLAWVTTDDETDALLKLCDWYHWTTRGIFDPTALPLIQLWEITAGRGAIPQNEDIAARQRLVGWSRIQRKPGSIFLPEPGMAIDFGGIGKEYAVDRVFEMAAEHGIDDILVDFGHDLRVRGEPPETGPWRIGLEDPLDPGRCWGGVDLRDRAVCSSGDYFRHALVDGKTYGHIIDPRSGFPVDNGCRSVTVIAPTCTEAGILSTTAFILGHQAGMEFIEGCQQAEGCICTGDQRYQSRKFHEYMQA